MKHTFKYVMAILCIALTFTACTKDTGVTADTNARIQFVQASPDGPNIDGYLNGSLLVYNLAYGNASGYFITAPGTDSLKITQTGSTTAFINTSVTLAASSYYTVFVVDSFSKSKTSTVSDDRTPPSSGKARIRFFNFCPNSPAMDIAMEGGDVLFANRTFNDQAANASLQGFTEVSAGPLSLDMRIAGTATALISVPSVTLRDGGIYTIYAKGFAGSLNATQTLTTSVIAHN